MIFRVIISISLCFFLFGCFFTGSNNKYLNCFMTERNINDKKAKKKWIEKYLPRSFHYSITNSEIRFNSLNKTINLSEAKKINGQLILSGDIFLKNSNGHNFPMTYQMTYNEQTKLYILKASPHKLFKFGEQKGFCVN